MASTGSIVSNHGGRNMDSAAASLDVLPEIAEAVGDKATSSSIPACAAAPTSSRHWRSGAKAVLTGRATLYGTAVGGEAGAPGDQTSEDRDGQDHGLYRLQHRGRNLHRYLLWLSRG